MKGFEKSGYQKKSVISVASSSGTNAIQKKSVSAIQNAAHEEELQQHKLNATMQKVGATDLEEKHKGVTQHKTAQENQSTENLVHAKENKTGMPDNLKSGIENLSGMSMDHVRVHYNSSQPAQLNALAYAQGSDVHVAPGQEKHLPHESWHIVQQAQGRVQPTTQMKTGIAVNDDPGLEHEADVMGEKALAVSDLSIQKKQDASLTQRIASEEEKPSQLVRDTAQRKVSVVQLGTAEVEERARIDALKVKDNILLIARELSVFQNQEITSRARSFTEETVAIMSTNDTFVNKCRKLSEKQDEIRKYIKTAKAIDEKTPAGLAFTADRVKFTDKEIEDAFEVFKSWEL
jgi:uncharacterized protein YdaT